MANGYYTLRHNKICKFLHWKICREEKIDVNNNIREHEPEPTVANKNIIIFYDKIISTGRYIEGNTVKLDIFF